MQLDTFRGPTMSSVLSQVRLALGDDAMIVRSENVHRGGTSSVEVLAGRPEDIEAFAQKLDGGRAAAVRASGRKRIRPYTLAFVGPAGAGKTTTTIKVALHPRGIGKRRVGLITLDTFRVGGIEELQTYGEIASLPVEVIYHPSEVAATLKRLAGVDLILVDTPGRPPKGDGNGNNSWCASLEALDPDEVHLVIPAGLRRDVVLSVMDHMAAAHPTHVLLTKLDEVPGNQGLVELVEAIDLPTRWVTDGPDIPGALAPAAQRIMAALGIRSDEGQTPVRRAG